MYNWNGRSNKEREVLFIQVLLGRDTSTSSLAQYGEFIPVEGRTEPDDKLLYYKDVVESIEITSTLQNNPDISDTEVINFTLDDSGYKVSEIKEEYGVSSDNSSYSSVTTWVENPTIQPLTLNTTNRYLWNKTTITLSNGSSDSSYKIISSFLADSGSISVSELIEYYAISPYNTYAPELIFGTEIGKWNTEKPVGISIDNRYIWNYNIVKFSDLSSQGGYNNAMIIGDYGNQVREVKFVDFSQVGSPYSISNGVITANEDWWNSRGGFGKVIEWDYVSDITQIQINDVIVIRGIATVTNNSVTVNCDTLINSRVTQIQPVPLDSLNPTHYKIKAITLNYVLEDVAIAQAELLGTRIFLVPSQDTYYLDNNNLILNPSDGKITVSLDYPATSTSSITVGSWSVSDGFGGWSNILFNSTVPTSIEVILSNFITYDFFQVKCSNIVYTDGDLEIVINELITTIYREVTSSRLELQCNEPLYKINPRYGDNYQIRNVTLLSIGFQLPDSYEWVASTNSESIGSGVLRISNETHNSCTLEIPYNLSSSADIVTLSYVSPDFDLDGIRIKKSEISINSNVATFTREGFNGFDGTQVGDQITLYWSEDLIEIQYVTGTIASITLPQQPTDDYILTVNISNSGQLDRTRVLKSEVSVDSSNDRAVFTRDNFNGFPNVSQNDHLILYWMEHDVVGGFVSGTVSNISTSNNTYTLTLTNINVGEVTLASLDFNGIYIESLPIYFGSYPSDLTTENLTGEYEFISSFIYGDSYFNESTGLPMFYDNGWISYTKITDSTRKVKLLESSLYDSIRNKSSALGDNENVRFFEGLASEDAFINFLMTNYLKLGKVLFSGIKIIDGASHPVDPNVNNIIFDISGYSTNSSDQIEALKYSKNSTDYYITDVDDNQRYPNRIDPNPTIIYRYTYTDSSTNDTVTEYYRYSTSLRDLRNNIQYSGFVKVDSDITYLSKYDFDDEGNLLQGIEIGTGFHVNKQGDFQLSNNFTLRGSIDSESLSTINKDSDGFTYSSSIADKVARYSYYDIYSVLSSYCNIDPGIYVGENDSLNGTSLYEGSSVNGYGNIVDIDYFDTSIPDYKPVDGVYNGRGLDAKHVTFKVRYDGYLYVNLDIGAPWIDYWWFGEDTTTVTVKLNNSLIAQAGAESHTYYGALVNSHNISVSRGDVVKIDWDALPHNPVGTSCNRWMYVHYYPNQVSTGLNFVRSSGNINIPLSYTTSRIITSRYSYDIIILRNRSNILRVTGSPGYTNTYFDSSGNGPNSSSYSITNKRWLVNGSPAGTSIPAYALGSIPKITYVNGYLYNDNFYSDRAHTNIITPDSTKIYRDLGDNRKKYRYDSNDTPSYTEVVVPTDYFNSSTTSFITYSVSIKTSGGSSYSYSPSGTNLLRLTGSDSSLTINGRDSSNFSFSSSDYYQSYSITFTLQGQRKSTVTKLLLPKDQYTPSPETGTDIGSDIGAYRSGQVDIFPNYFKDIYAYRIHNAVWNDYVDKLEVNPDLDLIPGKCYVKNGNRYELSTKYCQEGTLGIHSDTYAHSIGNLPDTPQLAISVSGYVLAYTDKRYDPGTPLTSGKDGVLTKMNLWNRMIHPERLVGTYLKDELKDTWNGVIKVNGRNWIKVK